MTGLLAALVRLGFGGVVDKALDHLERRAELQNDRERLRQLTTVELAKSAVAEAQIMADFNAAKLRVPWFWLFAGAFLSLLLLWFGSVVIYSIFWCKSCAFPQPWTIAALPPPLNDWAGRMIAWLFFVGTGVGVARLR